MDISVNFFESDKFKSNFISVEFIAPLDSHAAENELLMNVIRRGTEKHPTLKSVEKELDMLYDCSIDNISSFIGKYHTFGFSIDALKPEYTGGVDTAFGALDLVGEMLRCPLISDEITESEKKIAIDKVRSRINDKSSYSIYRAFKTFDPDMRVSSFETEEEISKITPSDLRAALERNLKNSPVVVCCTGKFDKEKITEKINGIFGGPERECGDVECAEIRRQTCREPSEVTEETDSQQSKLCMIYTTGINKASENYPAYMVFMSMLATSPVSRLFMNVREKQSLCYYIYPIGIKATGTICVTAGIDACNFEKARNAVVAEIDAFCRGDFTDEEVDIAKKSIYSSRIAAGDNPGFPRSEMKMNMFTGCRKTGSELVSEAMKVTPEEIVAVAKQLRLEEVYFLRGIEEAENGD